MNKFAASCALALFLSAGWAAGANASVIFSDTTPTPDTQLPGSYTYNFNSSATSALASIQLQGYNTLDGQNFYEDDFTLSLNGTAIYTATFDLGGGGNNVVYTTPAGSTFSVNSAARTADLVIPIDLVNGANSLVLSYASLPAPGHAGDQGLADEGFGINSVSVSAVPLPASAPLFGAALLALGVVGYGMKRKADSAA